MTPPAIQDEFARFAGELAESLSFNKSVGQIFGLLYLSPTPLSLDDVAKQLKMSKGNASINLRALEAWGAVRPVSVSGSRRDHYEANRNLKEIAMRRVEEGLVRRLELAETRLDSLLAYLGNSSKSTHSDLAKQLQELRTFVSRGRRAFQGLPKVMRLVFR